MAIEKRELKVRSNDGIHDLAGVVYLPEGEVRGFFHIVHGMTEHIGRYEGFMIDMAKEGFICFGYDNLGHGNTANSDDELGYIAPKDGWKLLVKDVGAFSKAIFAEYKRDNQPYCLMGHSMGSFIARLAAERVVAPDRLIIMGTGTGNPAAGAGIALADVIKLVKGGKHISGLMNKMVFSTYNNKFEKEMDEAPAPWLTNDKEIRINYAKDKFCTFQFTVSAMGDLIALTKNANRKGWYKSMSKAMPILIVSGEDDPVGGYGEGTKDVFNRLKKSGADVKCILYPKARHEILNDFTYEAVKKDILDFC